MLRGGHTVEVFRITGKDRHGEGVHTPAGTIEHVFIQWASASTVGLRFQATNQFQETSQLNCVAYAPRHADVRLQARDRFKFNGEMYQVIGDRAWDEDHAITGRDFGYYMVQLEMVS
jgi:hypothetical protein